MFIMKKALAFSIFIFLFVVLIMPQYAQETDHKDDDKIQTDTDYFDELPALYSKGDKTFTISLGLVFPTLFFQDGKIIDLPFNKVGGIGALAFNYFLSPCFFVGAELSGQFNSDIGKSTLYIIPLGLSLGYQFVVNKFEIPLIIAAGVAFETYLALKYSGLYLKGGASVYYRFSPDWSFGMDFSWSWIPQWIKDPQQNVNGNFINLTLSARYHF